MAFNIAALVTIGIASISLLSLYVYKNIFCRPYMDKSDFFIGADSHIVAAEYREKEAWKNGRT